MRKEIRMSKDSIVNDDENKKDDDDKYIEIKNMVKVMNEIALENIDQKQKGIQYPLRINLE